MSRKGVRAGVVLLLSMLAAPLWAGGFYSGDIDTYEPVTGLYYKAVNSKPASGGMFSSKSSYSVTLNVNIFDPATGKSTLLFETPQKSGIAFIFFETGFDKGSVDFYGASGSNVLNNDGIEKHPVRDKLLIGVSNGDGITLFTANKHGGEMKKIADVKRGDDWHLDMKNSKLRVIHQLGESLRIDSYDW